MEEPRKRGRPPKGKEKTPPTRKLVLLKHEAFANEVVKNGGNQTKAYQAVYPNTGYEAARTSASELVAQPHVQARVAYLLSRNPLLSLEGTLDRIAEAYGSTKVIAHSKDAVLTEVPDHGARLEVAKTVLKLHGLLKNDTNINIDNRQQAVIASPKEANEVIDKMLELNRAFRVADVPSGVIEVSEETRS